MFTQDHKFILLETIYYRHSRVEIDTVTEKEKRSSNSGHEFKRIINFHVCNKKCLMFIMRNKIKPSVLGKLCELIMAAAGTRQDKINTSFQSSNYGSSISTRITSRLTFRNEIKKKL